MNAEERIQDLIRSVDDLKLRVSALEWSHATHRDMQANTEEFKLAEGNVASPVTLDSRFRRASASQSAQEFSPSIAPRKLQQQISVPPLPRSPQDEVLPPQSVQSRSTTY